MSEPDKKNFSRPGGKSKSRLSKMNIIWVGSRPGRGSPWKYPEQKGTIRIDVSSGSMKKIDGLQMKNLSPLLLGPVYDLEGNQYVTMENLWQYNKVYPQLEHWDPVAGKPTAKWYAWRSKGMIKTKNGKGIRTPPEISSLGKPKPIGAWWNNQLLDYISSRKQIYIPKYIEAMEQTDEYKALKKISGEGILIIELDGPPLDKWPNGFPVTRENIDRALHNERYPYGHGYVIGAQLAGISMGSRNQKIEKVSFLSSKNEMNLLEILLGKFRKSILVNCAEEVYLKKHATLIGSGNQGNVYKLPDERILKVKIFSKFSRKSLERQKEDFLEECRIQSKAANLGIAPEVLEYNDHYMIMKYIDGRYATKNDIDNVNKTIEIMHNAGIIHNDLDPQNIIIDKNDKVYIIDFGIAKFSSNIGEEEDFTEDYFLV